MRAKIIVTAVSFISGNYVAQALGEHNWAAANERTFFQVALVAWIIFILTVDRPRDNA